MMEHKKEIERRDKKIELLKKEVSVLEEEIVAYRELLDCAVANIVILAKNEGGKRKISGKEVREILGRYKLTAKRDGEGNYLIEVVGN